MNEILYEKDVEQNGTALLPNPVQGKIEFRDVSFSYEESMDPVLNAISFRVRTGWRRFAARTPSTGSMEESSGAMTALSRSFRI